MSIAILRVSMERRREVTFLCLAGGMEWGTEGSTAWKLDWNGDNYTFSVIVSEYYQLYQLSFLLLPDHLLLSLTGLQLLL